LIRLHKYQNKNSKKTRRPGNEVDLTSASLFPKSRFSTAQIQTFQLSGL